MAKINGKECLSCRGVLWLLTFSGVAMTSIMEANLFLTIVAMVIPRPEAAAESQCKYDGVPFSSLSDFRVKASSAVANTKLHNVTHVSISMLKLESALENTTPRSHVQYPNRFAWNEYEQGLALGGIGWLQWATQLPGGLLARRYGTKLIFGWSNFGLALLGFFIPFCARYHFYALVFVRILQGFFGSKNYAQSGLQIAMSTEYIAVVLSTLVQTQGYVAELAQNVGLQ